MQKIKELSIPLYHGSPETWFLFSFDSFLTFELKHPFHSETSNLKTKWGQSPLQHAPFHKTHQELFNYSLTLIPVTQWQPQGRGSACHHCVRCDKYLVGDQQTNLHLFERGGKGVGRVSGSKATLHQNKQADRQINQPTNKPRKTKMHF